MKFCHDHASYQSQALPVPHGLADGNGIGRVRLRGNLVASDLERNAGSARTRGIMTSQVQRLRDPARALLVIEQLVLADVVKLALHHGQYSISVAPNG
jgi:hypothetical protein